MERALFSASFKSSWASSSLLCPRSPARFCDFDNHRNARLLIEHLERHSPHHLQISCLALQLSDSHSCQDWPRANGCTFKENGSFVAVASLLKFVHSLHAVNVVTSTHLWSSKPRDRLCHCSAEHGSSLSEPTAFNYLEDTMYSQEPGNALCGDGDSDESEQVADSAKSRLSNQMISDEIVGIEKNEQNGNLNSNFASSNEASPLPVKEPIYEVLEVKVGGSAVTKSVSRRLLLKTSGLRLRDIRSVDPSLWVTNAAPALLIRDQAILLNLGSLRAIASADNVLIFDYKSVGAAAFLDLLLQRLNPDSNPGVPAMTFELEVVEAALLSRTQRLERRLMEVEPRVVSLLEVLPNCLTANVLEELRLSKQALVELGSKANALRQMLLELLESPQEIRRMTIMGRRCIISKDDGSVECMASTDKQLADDEEEEMEMLLENYLQRCESCHGQAERLLDSAKEMEDSIAVNLSSRRLEVSRLELLLQVGTFCSALGALVAGIFGMNLKSYLEGNAIAFWLTTAGIVLGGIVLFFLMYNHLKRRKIL
ncbi:hypothetical protein GOP47_0020621 [Adiantum capillus-veneris]|uniref:Magnesium transporter n=1 Tax=Adiantum capillus-veneris TaxID=13818 RepID=A0A9D4U9H1_ADICA|nr:hypothetical protein GOP47_0020621 [Adiantum capillus-veneris]